MGMAAFHCAMTILLKNQSALGSWNNHGATTLEP